MATEVYWIKAKRRFTTDSTDGHGVVSVKATRRFTTEATKEHRGPQRFFGEDKEEGSPRMDVSSSEGLY
jgi:hypothetical protein